MDLFLDTKKAVVAGGASQIGRTIALTLAGEGCDAEVWDIDDRMAARLVEDAAGQHLPGRITSRHVDVRDHEAVGQAMDACHGVLGRIDIVANVAGGAMRNNWFVEKDRESWEWEIAVNLWGVINMCRAAAPYMVRQRYGRIVNIASESGRLGTRRAAVYSAAKAGVIGFSKALARELGRDGVCVNCVSPGAVPITDPREMGMFWDAARIESRRIPLEETVAQRVIDRFGTPQDIANVLVFLASDRCSWVTGQTWSVSGGDSML